MCICGQTWPASARGAETQSKIDLKRHLGARVANGASRDKIFSGRAVLNTLPFYAGCRGGGTRCTGVWIIETVPPMYLLAALKQADCNFSPPTSSALPPFICTCCSRPGGIDLYITAMVKRYTRLTSQPPRLQLQRSRAFFNCCCKILTRCKKSTCARDFYGRGASRSSRLSRSTLCRKIRDARQIWR